MIAISKTCLVLVYCAVVAVLAVIFVCRKNKILICSALALAISLLLQIAFNAMYPYVLGDTGTSLPLSARIVRVFSATLQMFTLDADYVGIMQSARVAFGASSTLYMLFVVPFVALTVLAPMTSVAVIIDILSRLIPKIRYRLRFFRGERYLFSELNEYTIEIAESIYNEYVTEHKRISKLFRPLIVFTDAYVDKSDERSAELLARAHNIGAICLRDDITECKLVWLFRWNKHKKVVYFLADKNEEGNLHAAAALLSFDNKINKWAKLESRKAVSLTKTTNMEMYVFARNSEVTDIIAHAYNKWNCSATDSAKSKIKYNVQCKVINEYKNLVYRLISGFDSEDGKHDNYPLYYSLLPKPQTKSDKSDFAKSVIRETPVAPETPAKSESRASLVASDGELSVVIVGGGRIGREFFKAAYHCGQMLVVQSATEFAPLRLNITVISDDALDAKSRLMFEMPEAFDSRYFTTNKTENYTDEKYCRFEFVKAEFGGPCGDENDFDKAFRNCGADRADYVLVALGDDERNMAAAQWIKREIDKSNLVRGNLRHVPVNYAIEDNDLCKALGEVSRGEEGECDDGCVLNAFGSLGERYACKNIYMTDLERQACSVDSAHSGKLSKSFGSEYDRNSSMASALHLPYKLASLGVLGEPYVKYDDIASKMRTVVVNEADYVNAVYWLEHRRWNAYMRSEGFRPPTANEFVCIAGNVDAHENYAVKDASKQFRKLGIHECIMECKKRIVPFKRREKKFCLQHGRVEALLNQTNDYEEFLTNIAISVYDGDTPTAIEADGNMDGLDRLGLLVGKDYKKYDIDVVSNIRRDALRGRLQRMINGGFTERDPDVATDVIIDIDKTGGAYFNIMRENGAFYIAVKSSDINKLGKVKFVNKKDSNDGGKEEYTVELSDMKRVDITQATKPFRYKKDGGAVAIEFYRGNSGGLAVLAFAPDKQFYQSIEENKKWSDYDIIIQ